MSSCDEFIFYDDLVAVAPAATRGPRAKTGRKKKAAKKKVVTKAADDREQEAIDLVLETAEALNAEGDREKLWGSMVKQALKRRRPGFTESYYGFRSFNDLLEEAQSRGFLEVEMDEKSGGYVIRNVARP